MLARINREKEMVVDNWGAVRLMTLKEIEWFDKIKETEKKTQKGTRILDPFKGWIKK